MTKNLHLEHIEDLMLIEGSDGIKRSFDYIDDLVKTFSGAPKNNRKISTKWDGAPAIFCGPDPADGKFFVAKKGIFNKKPILFKSIEEIAGRPHVTVECWCENQNGAKTLVGSASGFTDHLRS